MEIRCATFEAGYRELMSALGRPDYVCRPRGQLVHELLGFSLVLDDPRARLLASPARAADRGFGAGEFCWYLRGADDLESIEYYSRRMRDFSDDGLTLASAYGKRLRAEALAGRGSGRTYTQWQNVVEELSRDHDSRRAAMTICQPADLARALAPDGAKDVPCTLSMQFLVRRDRYGGDDYYHKLYARGRDVPRLHLVVTMRSCDAVWGLTNDLFSFTLLQEVMLLDLRAAGLTDLELGTYRHQAASMHVYERHFEMAAAVATETDAANGHELAMLPINDAADLTYLLDVEARMRADPAHCTTLATAIRANARTVVDAHGGAGQLALWLALHRVKRDADAARRLA